ncbi:MAG: ImmA/IrrE family metallo-endopeptidase [Actinobacteria bacterium]|nr:ImmA/IrrE family metallo-endopeptidase [Actinomycetota bacterium]
MSKVEALITPSVIKWARVTAKISIEEASKKLKRPIEDIVAWETGTKKPSIAQARKASEVYKRPLAVFYLPEPPQDFDTLKDFRRLPRNESREYDSILTFLMRNAVAHQEWTIDFLRNEGTSELSYVGSSSIYDDPTVVAENILKVLEITPDNQCSCRTRDDALRLWILAAEKSGVFIFREGNIDLQKCRGFVLSDKLAPFIFLNSEDAKAAQLFTLVHELCHIWLDQSGISNIEEYGRYPSDEVSAIEQFCNRVASEALLHRQYFNVVWSKLDKAKSIEDRIEKTSKVFKISEETIARRLLDDNVIGNQKYQELRDYYQARWLEFKEKERKRLKLAGGGPTFYTTKAFNNGYSYTQTVIGAFNGGGLSGRDASMLLGVKVNHLAKLALTVGIPRSS